VAECAKPRNLLLRWPYRRLSDDDRECDQDLSANGRAWVAALLDWRPSEVNDDPACLPVQPARMPCPQDR
jgi:hypothetical protein